MNVNNKFPKTSFVPSEPYLYGQVLSKKHYNELRRFEKEQQSSLARIYSTEVSNIQHEASLPNSEKANRRHDILKWIQTMDVESRIKLITIENKWFSNMVQNMIYYLNKNQNYKFLLRQWEYQKDEYYYYNLNQNTLYFKDSNPQDIFKFHAYSNDCENIYDQSFLDKIRFFNLQEPNDTFTLSPTLLANFEEFIGYIERFSKKKYFQAFNL
jgi:hypothetical protein